MDESEEFAQFTQSMLASTPAETPSPAASDTPADVTTEAPKAEATEKPPEAPKADKPEEKKPVDWKELAAKEKERRAQKAAARVNAEKQAREVESLRQKAQKLDEIMQLSGTKRLAALEKLGMTLDDVNTEYIRDLEENPNKPSPAALAAEKRIAQLEEKLNAVLQKDEQVKAEREKEQAQATRAKIQGEYETKASEAIKAKPDDYELLGKHPKGSEVVFHLIAAHYAETATFDEAGELIAPGEELDVHTACRRVEEGLLEQLKPYAESKKFRSGKSADSTTLAGDVRSPAARAEPSADDDNEFLNTTLRLIKQQSA